MDERVASLLSELENGASIDPLATRHRIVDLFGRVATEQDRISLLIVLDAVIGLAIRSQEEEGIDTQPLQNALIADKRLLVIKEAMGPNDLADPVEQLRILEREIGAGRMEQDSFYDLALAGAQVLGAKPKQRAKTGLFKRIFS